MNTTSPFFSFSSNVDEVDHENETSNFDLELEKIIKTILQVCSKTQICQQLQGPSNIKRCLKQLARLKLCIDSY